VVDQEGSDSAMFDNVLETLVIGAVACPRGDDDDPGAWHKHKTMSPDKRAFYEYHSCLMEPWTARRDLFHRRRADRSCARSQRSAPLRYTSPATASW